MIRHIQFSPDATATLFERYTKGACLRIIPHGGKEGTGVIFDANMIQPAQLALSDDDCDAPVNASHVCPPVCP